MDGIATAQKIPASVLNAEQMRAVTHSDGPLQIVAGAGTGKTRTLIHRLAHLIDSGVRPDRIALLTFTRRAALDMVQRAETVVAGVQASEVWGGTFHAMANRLLRLDGGPLGIDPGFTVLDTADASELMAMVRTASGAAETGRRFPTAGALTNLYSRVANTQQPLSEVAQEHFPWCVDHLEPIADLFGQYAARKHSRQMLDFDDLLLWWRAALEHPTTGPSIRDRFDHVLVDEYQDTNAVQADIVYALTADHGGVTVVGDDAQAIYSFRAATIANSREFAERFAGATVIKLEQNYRSTNAILNAANAALEPGTEHHPKTLWSARPDGSRPRLTTCADVSTEAVVTADRILEHRERGVDLRDQVVLFRTGHHSDRLEIELGARDIPFVKFGGLRFVEAAHVKDLVALVRVLDNPRDELAWHRILGLLQGVGPATTRNAAEVLDFDDGAALTRFIAGELDGILPNSARDEAHQLAEVWEQCLGPNPDAQPAPAVQVGRLIEFYATVLPHNHDSAPSRLADLDTLATLASETKTRAAFLADLVLDPPVSGSKPAGEPMLDDDWLTLSTVHSAKGGEWRVVHVIHAADGNIPSDMALRDPAGLEEERRLLHVALTRARDELEVTWPLRFHHHHPQGSDRHSYGQLSRFLEPIQDLFDTVGAGNGVDGSGSATQRVKDAPDRVGALLSDLWSR